MRRRWSISGAMAVACLCAAPAGAQAASFFTWASESEADYVGQGKTAHVTSDQAKFWVTSRVDHIAIVISGDGVPSYTAIFHAPRGQELRVGTYTDNFGTGTAEESAAAPGVDVSGEGRGCNSEQGLFTVRDLARDAAGAITRIHVVYDQRCTESTARLRGQVAYGYPEGTTPESIGSGSPGPAPAPADATRPVLGPLGLSRTVFRASRSGPSVAARAKVGTRVAFALSEPGPVTVAVQRRRAGRNVGRRCVAPTRSRRGRKRCTRWTAQRGAFTVPGTAGPNRFGFAGRMAARPLPRGRYRLALRARDAAGNASTVRRKEFRIAR